MKKRKSYRSSRWPLDLTIKKIAILMGVSESQAKRYLYAAEEELGGLDEDTLSMLIFQVRSKDELKRIRKYLHGR